MIPGNLFMSDFQILQVIALFVALPAMVSSLSVILVHFSLFTALSIFVVLTI
jgi:hypothetical protein